LTGEGTLLGTFQYMAPEQLEGKEADRRTDIFAFGTLLFEMATGRKAFEGTSQASLIASILTTSPPGCPSTRSGSHADVVPLALDHIVERCLAKDPDERWQTARDLKWNWNGSRPGVCAPSRRSRFTRRAMSVRLLSSLRRRLWSSPGRSASADFVSRHLRRSDSASRLRLVRSSRAA
jgi:serine/threonine protein kinase